MTRPDAGPAARRAVLDARAEIWQLAARYALAVDGRDLRMLRDLFAPGAVVVLPALLAGPAGATEIADPAGLLAPLARFVRTRHTLSHQVADVDGDTATAVTYGEAHHLREHGGRLRDDVLALRYRDTLARAAAVWRFTRRELVVDWVGTQPVRELGR
ncbi:MAG: hypothetical protein V7637_6355 [Mycobacteriales bacterium]|jgi:ketosteroid isomerase-like protein